MKSIVLLVFCIAKAAPASALSSVQLSEYGDAADNCTEDVCSISDNCRCASSVQPLESVEAIPQLVSLTFDEALTDELYYDYWEPLLYQRVNPDGRRIGATFFVPHEYTNYQRVNDLYNHGFEIAVHSITNDPLQAYWRGASEELLEAEFGGQRKILSKFANIPIEDIVGVRTPQLQLAGNLSIEAYMKSGLSYDSSWPSLHSKPLFPYTLDYLSTQQCILGAICPNEAFKGFWILPIVDLNGNDTECNNLASCRIRGTADEIAVWLLQEINKVRDTTRVPITLLINSIWFINTESSWEGLNQALEALTTYGDTFLVSQRQVLDWIKNPVNVSEFRTAEYERDAKCQAHRCSLRLEDENRDRYMSACEMCPAVYPWLRNPDGDA